MLTEQVKECLRFEGVQEDDIRELDNTGLMLVDMVTARDSAWELIEQSVAFKCEQTIDEMFKITLL